MPRSQCRNRQGVLAVPGASTDVDTAPLNTDGPAYTISFPSPDIGSRNSTRSKQQLYSQELNAQRDAPTASEAADDAVIGAEVPAGVASTCSEAGAAGLGRISSRSCAGTTFMRSAGRFVIVGPQTTSW